MAQISPVHGMRPVKLWSTLILKEKEKGTSVLLWKGWNPLSSKVHGHERVPHVGNCKERWRHSYRRMIIQEGNLHEWSWPNSARTFSLNLHPSKNLIGRITQEEEEVLWNSSRESGEPDYLQNPAKTTEGTGTQGLAEKGAESESATNTSDGDVQINKDEMTEALYRRSWDNSRPILRSQDAVERWHPR